jgi:predicted signal transduction protein with EAL and GGDEF domain
MVDPYATACRMKAIGSQGVGERACLLLRPLCRLPGLRRSLVAQLTVAAAMTLVAPVAMALWAARSSGLGDQATATVIVAAAMVGLAGFAGLAHCLSEPIRQMIRMVRAYRVGDTLQPPAEVQYDEIGALVGETLQTLREANAHMSQRARRDTTTGALNRDGLDAELGFVLRRAEGQRQGLLVLIELRELGRWEMALGVDTVQSVRRAVVERLRETAPAAGAVAALGPTWFAWAASGTPEEVDEAVGTLWERMRAPIDCGEALARWEHPEHGRISPATFIPLAYSSGRIVALGRHMIDQAVAAVAEWRCRSRDLTVSINIDADHLTSGTLETDVVAALIRHGVPSAAVELEVTEASLLTDLEGASAQIVRLRERGVLLALDDFGTGYSSLGYLGRLPIDRVKIVRSRPSTLGMAVFTPR